MAPNPTAKATKASTKKKNTTTTAKTAEEASEDQPFRLLDLPPELWVKIGKMAIDEEPRVVLKESGSFFSRRHPAIRQSTITRTCRVLRQELLPYYYEAGLKVTAYADDGSSRERLGYLLRGLKAKDRKKVRGVRVSELSSWPLDRTIEDLKKSFWEFEFELQEEQRAGENRKRAGRTRYHVRFL